MDSLKKHDNRQYWNNVYEGITEVKPVYDLWLDKFKDILKENKGRAIIDLGCGAGNNTLYLCERGYKVISCDYSREALSIVNEFIPEAETMEMDLTERLPFEDDSTEVVIADLCLHYFSKYVTRYIINEIKRVLCDGGKLIFRVNSINDINYGAGSGTEVEKNFYRSQSGFKRYFDEEDIRSFFSGWSIEYLKENTMYRYDMEKRLYECMAVKP